MQLGERSDEFQALGLGLAAMTYDDADFLRGFAAEQGLPYPMLADESARHVLAYGVLNEAYGPDDDNYGLPHPGILWIGADGRIRGKWAVPGYRERPSFDVVLADVRAAIDGD